MTATGYTHLAEFWTATRLAHWRATLASNATLFRRVDGNRGFGPRYRVIDGDTIAAEFPELEEFARGELREIVERETGTAVELMNSLRRSMHVQVYERVGDGFRWHFDGHAYAAILTLENSSGGATEILRPALSRWLRAALYLTYPWPVLFSALPRQRIVAQAGDLVIVQGASSIHRGTNGEESGERWTIVCNYEVKGRRPRPLRDWIARRVNY